MPQPPRAPGPAPARRARCTSPPHTHRESATRLAAPQVPVGNIRKYGPEEAQEWINKQTGFNTGAQKLHSLKNATKALSAMKAGAGGS